MGSNHMHDFFRSKKKDIPTHDPYTGELNPLYEELTGNKNPLEPKENKSTIPDHDIPLMDDLVKSLEGRNTFNSARDVYIINKLITFYKENK
tara:strand:- start:1274 stop:1549 length:276 start_codon:yes stop_codon:yes gene_type:complete